MASGVGLCTDIASRVQGNSVAFLETACLIYSTSLFSAAARPS